MTTRVRAEMPEANPKPPRERGWWIGIVGFVLIAAAMFAWGWSVALEPNGYAGHLFRQGETYYGTADGQWKFPTQMFIDFAKALAVEIGIVGFTLAIRVRPSVAKRSLILGLLMIGFLFLSAPFMMHSSAPVPQFIVFQLVGAVWLILFGLVFKGLARLRPVR